MKSTAEELSVLFEIIEGKSSESRKDLPHCSMSELVSIYDFGNSTSYFGIIAKKGEMIKASSHELSQFLLGSYLFVYLNSNVGLSLGIAISNELLNSQGFDIQQSRTKEKLNKTLTNLFKTHSLEHSRYILFQQQFEDSSLKMLFLKMYCTRFLYTLVVHLDKELNPHSLMAVKNLEINKILEIEQNITNGLSKNLPTVKEMASMADMSISKFKNLFHEIFGTTPHQYFLDKKLIFAMELLQSGRYSISQVSYKVGFVHPSDFARRFKSKFQLPPSLIYNQHQQ